MRNRKVLSVLFVVAILVLLVVFKPFSINIDSSRGPGELTWGPMGAVLVSTDCDFVLSVDYYQTKDLLITTLNYQSNFVLVFPFGGALCWYYVPPQSIPIGARSAEFFKVVG